MADKVVLKTSAFKILGKIKFIHLIIGDRYFKLVGKKPCQAWVEVTHEKHKRNNTKSHGRQGGTARNEAKRASANNRGKKRVS